MLKAGLTMALTAALVATVAASAPAATLYHDGADLRYEADPQGDGQRGEDNALTVEATTTTIEEIDYEGPSYCWQLLGCFPPKRYGQYRHEAVVSDPADTIATDGEGCCLSSDQGRLACDDTGGHAVRCAWINAREQVFLEAALGAGDDSLSTQGITGIGVRAGAGTDTVHGTPGRDYVYGEGGGDRLVGGPGEDLLAGLCADFSGCIDGDDWIDARDGGQDTVLCGAGHDVVLADAADAGRVHECEDVRYTTTAGL